MSHLQQRYKNPSAGFGDADHRRFVRAYMQEKSRKATRMQDFSKVRRLQDASAPASPQSGESGALVVTNDRTKKLMKWKEERDKKKRLESIKKRPAFKVGIMHHSIYSPATKSNTAPSTSVKSSNLVKPQNEIKKRVTKATEKRLLAKKELAAFAAQKVIATKTTKSQDAHIKKTTPNIRTQRSFAPSGHKFRPPSGLPKLPLFGVVAIEETPLEKGDFFENKLGKCDVYNTNNQKDTSEKLDIENVNDAAKNLKNSGNTRLSSKKEELNKLVCGPNNTTPESNKIITAKLSLSKQNIQESFPKEESLVSNIDVETLTPKTPVINKSSEKENCNEDLILFSPYLTLSRGKKNARKEQMARLGIGRSPSNDIPTKDTVMKNLNISIEEEERTSQYFKFLLSKETDRLQELCAKWMDIRLEKDIPEDAMYEISQAVGQTNLLINKKFERFRSLVSDCESGKGQMLVTCKDLQGFWDMTYMEVKDCDLRFEKLEQRRDRGWEEEHSTIIKPATKKRRPNKKQIVPSKPSSLRSLILAARRKKMGEPSNMDSTLLQNTSISKDTDTRYNTRQSKLLDDNTFKLTPVKHNSSRVSLIKSDKVHLSDATKMTSPLTVMKISQIYKTPEVHLDDTISYINSDQTPGKSILKKSEDMLSKEIRIKSAHKVIFNDQIALTEESNDEETLNKKSLTVALERINSLDLNDIRTTPSINAEKRLDFDTDDSDDEFFSTSNIKKQLQEEVNVTQQQDTSVQNISDSKKTPRDDIKNISSRKSSRRQSRSQHENTMNSGTIKSPLIFVTHATPLQKHFDKAIVISDIKETDLETRTLRNRVILTNNTPKTKRTSRMVTPKRESTSKKENESPVKSDRKKSLKFSQIDENNYTELNENNTEMDENVYKRRRSSRKSVAFNAESCFVCSDNKPVLPMTPHSKLGTSSRQRRSSKMKQETPKSVGRVTRSHTEK